MNITRIETGTIVALVLAVIGVAVQFGRLQGQIDSLNPDTIRDAQNAAVGQIEDARRSAIDEMNGQAATIRIDDLSALTDIWTVNGVMSANSAIRERRIRTIVPCLLNSLSQPNRVELETRRTGVTWRFS